MADLGIGTAFPGSPSLGDWFTRSDLGGEQFVYTSGGWTAINGNAESQIRVDQEGGLHVTIAAGKSTDTLLKSEPGLLKRVVVFTTGTNPLQIEDANASGGTGDVIGALPASPAIGPYDFEMPAAAGILVKGNAANPAITISFE